MVDGHPHRGIKRFTRMFAVTSAVNSAVVTANMSSRRLKQSVKRRMYECSVEPLSAGAQSSQHCRRRQGCWVRGWRELASGPSGGRSYALDIFGSGAPTISCRLPYQPTSRSVQAF